MELKTEKLQFSEEKCKRISIFNCEYLQHRKEHELAVYEKVHKEILERKSFIEEQVEKFTFEILSNLKRKWMEINENITKQERHFREKPVNVNSDNFIFFKIEPVPLFTAGECKEETISTLFGKLNLKTNNDFCLKKHRSIDAGLTYVNPLCAINDSTVYACCAADGTIEKASKLLTSPSIEEFLKLDVCSLVPISSHELLISTSNGTALQKIRLDGSIQTSYEFAPLVPKGICITENNELIVGLREATTNPFSIREKSTRQVCSLDEHGRTKNIFEFDENHHRLFTVPTRIATKNGAIYVLDMKANDHGRIMAIHMKSNLKWIYQGHEFTQYTFCPNDISISSDDMIIISDTFNNSLHFLNTSGEILHYETLTKFNVYWPCSVFIDYKDRLWIGTGKNKDKDAHIYMFSLK